MKRNIKNFVAILFAAFVSINLFAYDFVVDGIYYNNHYDGNVSVTFKNGYKTYSGNVTIPATVTYNGTTYNVIAIGSEAFLNCFDVDTVIISEGVSIIGTRAFKACYMKSITIPNSVTTIKAAAFYQCRKLRSITIPKGITTIKEYTFTVCDSLRTIEWPDSITSIGDGAFGNCYSLTSLTIPNSVTTIGKMAFEHCRGLKSIEISNSVTTIEKGTFRYCDSLTSITIPNSVTTIDTNAFQACYRLTSITIPNSVTTIGMGVFEACSTLTSLTIPNSVTTIGQGAFWNCINLDTIVCKATTPPLMGADVFHNTPTTKTLFVPCGTALDYGTKEGWNECAEIIELPCINVTTNDATNITENAATLNGEVSTTGEVTAKGFQYKTTDEDYTTIDVTTDEFVYNLTGLESDAEYTFRAFAVVEEDTTFGEEKTFVTLDDSGIEDIAKENTISIYPNPAHNNVTIEGKGEVVITNSLGQVVKEIKDNNTYRTIDIKDFERGVYYIKVGNVTTKLVIE